MQIKPRFFGWSVAQAVFLLAVFGFGIGFYGVGVYLNIVVETRSWSVALVSGAVTMHFLVAAAVMPCLSFLYRRFGVAQITKLGTVLLALGVLGWATAEKPSLLYAASLVSGAGWAATGGVPINAIVSPWFDQRRPVALSLAYNGGSVGGLVFPVVWISAIGLIGFPWAATIIGGFTVIVMWVVADRYFVKSPISMGLKPDGDDAMTIIPHSLTSPLPGKLLWLDKSFITLAAAMSLALFVQFGMIAHLFSLLVPALGTRTTGFVMGSIGAAAIVGRAASGYLLKPGSDRRNVAAINCGVQLVGSIAFVLAAGDNAILLMSGVVLLGFGIGNGASLPPLIAQTELTKGDVDRAVPVIIAIAQASSAFAPAAFGLIREFSPQSPAAPTGAAPYLFIAAALIQLLAILVFLSGRGQRIRHPDRMS